ncbi:unnamed protein product [Meganyctiphanes norvegica]|uniref:Tetraspanin n=1 Tax=Meganyctiphanes norvegica TaxID=48144 RepID=A0AAV2PNT4_MEGNR
MGCCNKLALFLLNFVVFLLGVAVVVVASLVISKGDAWSELLQDGNMNLPIVVLAFGAAVLLIGFLGCCGALRQNACMLNMYAVIVLVLVIAQIVLGALILAYKDTAEDVLKKGMTEAFNKYNNGDEELKKTIDLAQHDLECCGVDGFKDWQRVLTGTGSISVPDGCCVENVEDCGVNYFIIKPGGSGVEIYKDGCFEAFEDVLGNLRISLGALAIGLAFVQLITVFCACHLARESKKSKYRH